MTRPEKQGRYYIISASFAEAARGAWRPNMDIYETDEHVVVSIEVPGISADDIGVTEYPGRIVVRGVRRPETSPVRKRYHQIEIVCGEFEKEIMLGGPLAGAKVEAHLALGILSLRISKTGPRGEDSVTSIRIEA